MFPKRLLHALHSQQETFAEWTPSVRVAAGVIVLLCVVNGASAAVTGGSVTDAVSGSVTVENPNHPPEFACDGTTNLTVSSCGAPETIEKSLRPAASSVVDGVVLEAALTPLAWAVVLAGLFVLVSGRGNEDDEGAVEALRDGLGVAAVAAIPGVLRYLGRPVLVERALADWTHPGTLDGVRAAAASAMVPNGPVWLVVAAVSGGWTAVIVYGGVSGVFGDGRIRAAVAAAVAFLTSGGVAAVSGTGLPGLPVVGLLVMFVGFVGFIGAETYIVVSKEFELIGFSGSDEVDPQPWYVALHRIGAFCVLLAGFALVAGSGVV